jgi:hypothetical protein
MAKFTAVIIAAAALLTSVQAAPPCPANGVFCGSELVDVYKCRFPDIPGDGAIMI